MRRFLLTVLIVCLTSMVYAGKPTTEGSEFWLTFMNNLDESNALELRIVASSRYDATVSVLNPQTKWTQSFNVSANQIAEFAIPKNQGYTEGAEIVEKRGLLITSTAPISLYAQNYSPHIYDATLVMPVNGLGTQYIIQTFENELFAKECAIVATEDNTRVTITPHARTTADNAKNVPFQVTLKRGETYQVMSLDENADFSGTRIESDKKVAVFSGHRCINTPTGNRWCDHIVEQQMPTDMWGRQFVVTKTKGQNGDMVMVTASADNTVVKLNGSQVKTLQALESYEFRLTDNSGYIETTQPSAVYLYLEGAERNNMIGDPSSVHISPIEQMLPELTFATFQTNESRTHYINLVTTAAGAAQMLLDGKSIAAEFQPVQGNNALRFAQINVQHGTHTLKTSKDGFVGHVYGLGFCESYAYTFGSATLLLNGQILVDGEPRIDIDYDESRCYKQDITFSVSADAAYNSLKWDLGDGTESTQPTVKHTYAAAGDYTVTLVLTGDDDRDTARTVLHLVETLSDTVYTTICDNEKYVWNGTEYTVKGTYKQTLTSAGGCDSIVTLILNVNSTAFSQEKASIPLGSSYRWHWKWFNTAGTYRDTLLTATGCDSICELVLETVDQTETIYDTICYQPSYEFMGQTFSIPSVAGETDDYVNYVLELRDLEECSAKQLVLSISTLAGGDYEIYDTIQQGMTYEFYGQKLTTPGTYTATASSGRGCEQNYTLHLAVLSFPINEEYLAFCHENEIVWRGKTLNKTGVYNDTVFTPAGIEAIYRLYLTDNRSRTEISENTTGPYTLNGITYSESGTYTQTRTNAAGCDSLIILHLGINEKCKINTEESMRICEGQSVKWNGKTYSAAGDYTWSTVTKNGCDSIVTLHLATAETKTTLLEKSICEGDFLRYNGDRLYEAKDYIYTFTSAEGCDSIVTVRISYNQSYLYSEIRVIEEGSSIMWQGETYSQAGTYKKGFIAKNGCDSIFVLELSIVKPCETTYESVEASAEGSYTWELSGETYTESGEYTFTTTDENGCEVITTLHLTITEPVIPCETTYESVEVSAEGSYTWTLSGETYTQSGEYQFTTTDENGCEVITTLHLTITEPVIPCETTYESVEASAEGSYTWELSGETYTESGEYTFTTTDENGCEVVVTLHLTITEPVIPCETTYESVEVSAEGSYTWELSGETYTESGEYTFTTTDENGCEVVVTLHLIITEPVIPCETTYESVDVTAEGSYTWALSGETYTESGEYQFTTTDENGCEVVVTLHLTITEPVIPCETTYESVDVTAEGSYTWGLSGETYTESGEYTFTTTDENGCEVVVTLHLIISTKPRHDESLVAAICEGEEYDFFGDKLTESGSYSNTVETDDEIVDYFLELTVNPAYDKDLYATIEEGEVYMWNEKAYNAEGDYKFEGKTVAGCDSIVTLHLVVNFKPMRNENISASICDGDYYEFYGEKLTKKGTYTHTETGDKEIVNYILTLTVNPVYNKNEYATITDGESYSWNGKKYKEQGNYVYYGSTVAGCDSIVTLHLTVKQSQTIEHSSLSVENSCADERAIVLQLTYDNKPDRVRLTFTGRDKAAGLPDTTITNVTETIVVHHNARAGQYKATAHLYIGNSEVNKTTAEFTLLYPSTVLEQAWNDVVIVLAHNYNGGYDFKAFEWYKNGQLLLGETGSYIYQPLEFGAEYSARLTETNGIQLMTCPLVAEPHEDITLYPTRIRAGQHVNCKVTDEASMYVYDSTGKMILTQQLRQGESELILPLQHGMYIVNIVLNGTSTARQYKLVVNE